MSCYNVHATRCKRAAWLQNIAYIENLCSVALETTLSSMASLGSMAIETNLAAWPPESNCDLNCLGNLSEQHGSKTTMGSMASRNNFNYLGNFSGHHGLKTTLGNMAFRSNSGHHGFRTSHISKICATWP